VAVQPHRERVGMSRRINGGLNGYADRRARLAVAKALLA
jgi:predicted chitinase